MVIDFHVHCFPDEVAVKAIPALAGRAGISARLTGKVEDIKKSMKDAGVDHSVLLSIATNPTQTEKVNTWTSEVNDGKVIGFGSIHPEYKAWKQELNRIAGLGLKGIKLHPDYQTFFVDDKEMYPIYDYAAQLGLIIVFHAGIDIGLPEIHHCTPERLLKVVKAFPGARIVAAHMGGYSYWNDVEKYLVGTNVYLDTAYSIGYADWNQMKRIIQSHDPGKILFATDSPWCDQKEEIEKLKSLQLEEDLEKKILGQNAAGLLGIG